MDTLQTVVAGIAVDNGFFEVVEEDKLIKADDLAKIEHLMIGLLQTIRRARGEQYCKIKWVRE